MSKFILFLFLFFYFYCKASFESINDWYKELKENSNPTVKIILVGNKNDLENERKVDKKEVETLMDELDIDLYLETSAKTGDNVETLFVEAAKLLYKDYISLQNKMNNKDNNSKNSSNNRLKLLNINGGETEEKKGCFC